MTCPEAREILSARLDGAASADEEVRLEAHLATCEDCRRERDRLARTVGLLRAVEPARAPVGFVDRVLAAARPAPWYRRLTRRLFVPWPRKVPLEAAAVLLVAGTAVYLFQRAPEVREAVRDEAPAPVAVAPAPSATPHPGTLQEIRPEPLQSREAPAPRPGAGPGAAGAPPPPPPRSDTERDQSGRFRAAAPTVEAPAGPESAATAPPPAPATPAIKVERQESPAAAAPAPAAKSAPEPASPRASEVAKEGSGTTVDATRDARQAPAERKAAAPPRASSRLRSPADVSGRLTAPDREAASGALTTMVAGLGGAEILRRVEPDAVVVEVTVPRESYATLATALGHLGRWRPEREPAELPSEVRVEVRIAAD